jgi:hypothetical protein
LQDGGAWAAHERPLELRSVLLRMVPAAGDARPSQVGVRIHEVGGVAPLPLRFEHCQPDLPAANQVRLQLSAVSSNPQTLWSSPG